MIENLRFGLLTTHLKRRHNLWSLIIVTILLASVDSYGQNIQQTTSPPNCQGSTKVYVMSNGISVSWSVTGGGSIVGPTSGTSVTVQWTSNGVVNAAFTQSVCGYTQDPPYLQCDDVPVYVCEPEPDGGQNCYWTTQQNCYTVTPPPVYSCWEQNENRTLSVSVTPTPLVYSVGGGGSYCGGGTGPSITLSGSESGVTYNLYRSGSFVSSLSGTGGSLSWSNQPGNYSYTITASRGGCPAVSMSGSVSVSVIATPNLYSVGGGGSYCSGSGGSASITLSGSETGVTYSLLRNGALVTNTAGTGGALNWAGQSGTFTYTVTASRSGCPTVTMTGSAVVTQNPLPTTYTVSGGGSLCSGAAGVTISLSGSQTGVNYQLKNGSTSVGSPLAGTGSALSWTNNTSAGSYTVVATNATTLCQSTMTGSASVTVNPLPALYTLSGGGTICAGSPGLTLTLSGSQTGINYQLRRDGTPVGSAIAGTGSALNWSNNSTAGSYTVLATNATTGCNVVMTGTASIANSALPTGFTVSGGGSLCAGATGVSISLSGSQTGISYQLKNGSTSVGSPLSGTGSALNWTNISTAGSYTIVATNTSSLCTQTMTGSATVVVNPAPTSYSMGGGGNICSGAPGLNVTLSGSQSGVNYQLRRDGVDVGSVVAGTGASLTWTGNSAAGSYTVYATNTTTNCGTLMTGTSSIVLNPVITSATLSGTATICNGQSTSITVTIAGGTSPYSFSIDNGVGLKTNYVSGTPITVSPTSTATYSFSTVVTDALGCTLTGSGSAVITVRALPTNYTVGGGGSYCTGGTGVSITLSGSQTGVNYQLRLGASNVGSPLTGTGGVLSWTNQVSAGSYSVLATNTSTGCARTMSGTATVTVNPLPTIYNVSGSGSYCQGSSGSIILLSGSQTGVSYQLLLEGVSTGSPLAGTGSSLSWPSNTATGNYTVNATNNTTLCYQLMSGTTVVSTTPLPASYVVSGGGTMCEGATGFSINLSGSQTGVTYQLKVDGVSIGSPLNGTGSALVWTQQTANGSYTVNATITSTGCTQSMTGSGAITVNPKPTAYNFTGGGNKCPSGAALTFTLDGSQVGVNYQLKRGTSNVGAAKAGTGTALTWTNNSTAGTYTVVGTNSSTSCTNTMAGQAILTVLAQPNTYTLSAPFGNSYCSGGAGVTLRLSGSQTGVTYQLRRGSSTLVGSPLAGTGGTLEWPSVTTGGTYRVDATLTSSGCKRTMTGSISVVVNALPTAYNTSGGGVFCEGTTTGVNINLSDTQSGINYELLVNGTPTGNVLAGTGNAVVWTGILSPGTHTVLATNTTTGCSRVMNSSAVITMTPLPQADVSGPNTISGSAITINAVTNTGQTYQWFRDSDLLSGKTANTLSVNSPGSYQVRITTSGGCVKMSAQFYVSREVEPLFNGTITSMRWNTEKAYATEGEDYKGMYFFNYDEKYQIKEAQWADPNFVLNNFSLADNQFRLANMSYDPNGNILTLDRFDGAGSRIHNFTYGYQANTNKLQSVSGYVNAYTYNAIGQMIGEDKVDGDDQYVEYDVTGKVRKVFSDAAKTQLKVEFQYDDRGFRLTKINYETSKTTWYIRDASGNVISIYDQEGVPVISQVATWTDISGLEDQEGILRVPTGGTTGTARSAEKLLSNQDGYLLYKAADVYNSKNISLRDPSGANDYRLNFYPNHNIIAIRRGGIFQTSLFYSIGDILKIERVGDIINFYHNDIWKYSLSTNPNLELEAYVSLLEPESTVTDLQLYGFNTESPIQTEVPIYGSGKLATYYPQENGTTAYELTDHLGNVRAILKNNVVQYQATMEDSGIADITNPRVQEDAVFKNLFETEVRDFRMNHTPPGAVANPEMAAYLFWQDGMTGMEAADKAIGPAINLKVNPGDTVNISVWAKYEKKLSYGRGAPQGVLATALGGTFALTEGLETLPEAIQAFTDALPLISGATASDPDTQPYAYLNYLIFDEQFNSLDAGAMRVPTTAGFDPGFELLPHQELKFDPVIVNSTGFMYIWVSNESENTKVWFDDLTIRHQQRIVTQATDYGPWGDIIREQKTNLLDLYRYGYQGQFAEKDDETGWNHFELREYDPITGRWTSIDPKRQYFSPYLSMGNNPTLRIDPDGGDDWVKNNSTGEYVWDPNAVSQSTTQKGFTYVGPGLQNVYNHFASNRSSFDFWSEPNINFAQWPGELNPYKANGFGDLKEDIANLPLVQRVASNAVYNTVDELYISFLQQGDTRFNLEGFAVTRDQTIESGLNTVTSLFPLGTKGLNASQFSKTFKGTFIPKMQPRERGFLNRVYNFFHRERINIFFNVSQDAARSGKSE